MDLNYLFEKLRRSESQLEYYDSNKKSVKKFREVFADVITVAAYLSWIHVNKGKRVGIMGKNSYEWIVIDLACVISGVITIPFDISKKHDVNDTIETYNLSLLLHHLPDEDLGYYDDDRVCSFNRFVKEAFESIASHKNNILPVSYDSNDVFTVISTSGSSGNSKYIEVRKKSFDHLISGTQNLFQFKNDDRFLVFLPLNIYLERCYIYAAILLDFHVILTPLEYLFHSIQHDKPSVIIGIPYFFENFHNVFLQRISERMSYKIILRSYLGLKKIGLAFLFNNRFKPFIKAWGGNIRYLLTGAAPIQQSTLKFYQDMGITLYEGYGMSEIGGMITLNSPGNVRLGSVGKPFPGKEVVTDEEGQILVKSEFNANTSYLKSTPLENERTYLGNYTVATGDLGYLDKDGFLYINGRKKDLIILSTGKKIHPTYIEEQVMDSGFFKHCIVYGDSRPYLVALLIPKSKSASDFKWVKSEIDRVNMSLTAEERIGNFYTTHDEFTVDNSLLTSTLKINRQNVIRRYEDQFINMYK
jgi:long-chain acyl-CoA synthetase